MASAPPRGGDLRLWRSSTVAAEGQASGPHNVVIPGHYHGGHWDGGGAYRWYESDSAYLAREHLMSWLVNDRPLLAHARWVVQENPGWGAAALLSWADQLLYGRMLRFLPREMQGAVQSAADIMARADFCALDWGSVANEVSASTVEPAPVL